MSRVAMAVLGVGYLGRFHAHKLADLASVELVGVCDIDASVAAEVGAELGTASFASPAELVGRIEAVSIATSTSAHFELARFFLEHGVHVFVEKPITRTSEEAAALVQLAARRDLKLQVGHIERFNPALLAARSNLKDVRFIECHRLAAFKGRGVDVDVVLDLMIHDLDVILSLVDSTPASVSAVGLPVLTDKIDIANARIEFENGAIANVTASRVSTSVQRKFRVFQPNQYISIDFDARKVQRVISDGRWTGGETPFRIDEWNLDKGDALKAELAAFVDAVRDDTECLVTGEDGRLALALAEKIVAAMQTRAARGLEAAQPRPNS
jgi:predicted dehydrogenase